jgi:hypothetical protein
MTRRRRGGAPRCAVGLAAAAALVLVWVGVGVREAAAGTAPDGAPCAAPADCQSGFCAGGVCCASACQAADDCHTAVCDSTSGACVSSREPDGTPCDDHDACTRNDVCLMGSGIGGTEVVCAAEDACHAAGVCAPDAGCTKPVVPGCDGGTPGGPGDAGDDGGRPSDAGEDGGRLPGVAESGSAGCQHAAGSGGSPDRGLGSLVLGLALSRRGGSRARRPPRASPRAGAGSR